MIFSQVTNVADASVIEVTSSTDENTSEIDSDNESLPSPSPVPLKPAQGQIDVVYNKKASTTLYSSNLDLNMSFNEFLDHLDECIAKKTKQPEGIIKEARKVYRYIWMTKYKSQQKTLPRYNDFDGEDHYQALQKEVRTTSKKNRELDDMILRFHIDVKVRTDTGQEDRQEDEGEDPPSPSRATERKVFS
jgi:hypothetical protein